MLVFVAILAQCRLTSGWHRKASLTGPKEELLSRWQSGYQDIFASFIYWEHRFSCIESTADSTGICSWVVLSTLQFSTHICWRQKRTAQRRPPKLWNILFVGRGLHLARSRFVKLGSESGRQSLVQSKPNDGQLRDIQGQSKDIKGQFKTI